MMIPICKLMPHFVLVSLLLASHVLHADTLQEGVSAYESQDYKKAANLLAPLAEKSNPVALNLMGLMYHHGLGFDENDDRAFEYFSQAAERGLTDAQYNLANMLMYGYGVPNTIADPETEAARQYINAATAEHAEAQYTLGLLLLSGKIVIQDTDEAISWMKRAAAQGHADAQSFLGQYSY